jgi:hypothetical protein
MPIRIGVRIKLGKLRQMIREVLLNEETWLPGRYYPAAEPLPDEDLDGLCQPLGEEDDGQAELDEVDTDPSNNPGRPSDAFDYLGMHPKPEAAMAHPGTGGAGGIATPESGTEDA